MGGEGAGRSGGGRFASRALEEREVRALLRRRWWGDLGTVGPDGAPWVVPVVYGWDGERFWVASKAGRKVENLRVNPAVSLTVVEVAEDASDWASVVVRGRAEVVDGVPAHLAALRALRKQRGIPENVGPGDALQFARAEVIRIDPEAISGRCKA